MVVASGPDRLSLRKLTDAVGTSTSAVYSLYGSRDALLLAVYERANESFAASQELPLTDSPERDLFAMGLAYRRWALENPQLYPLMFIGGSATTSPSDKRKLAGPTMDRLTDAVERCMESGFLNRERSAGVVATQLWAMVHGFVSLELIGVLGPEVSDRSAEEIDQSFKDLLRSSVAIWRA